MCRARSEGDGESGRRLKTELMVQMSDVKASDAHVLVLAATNCPYDLDEAFRRRFGKVCRPFHTLCTQTLHFVCVSLCVCVCLSRSCELQGVTV